MANFGINPKNITAIDLHSYSPLIKLGDMHSLPFSEKIFDACILTHCIAYSEAPEIAFKEALKVLKAQGSLIFTVSSVHESKNFKDKSIGKNIPRTGAKRILSFKEYYRLACNLTENQNNKEFQFALGEQPFMRAGIITK